MALADVVKRTAVDVVCMEYRAAQDELGMKWFDLARPRSIAGGWPAKPA
jgi:hypothetical protein